MRIENFKIKDVGESFIDPKSYCPKRKIVVELELEWDAQWDGHWSEKIEMECFYESAKPMLDHIKQATK